MILTDDSGMKSESGHVSSDATDWTDTTTWIVSETYSISRFSGCATEGKFKENEKKER